MSLHVTEKAYRVLIGKLVHTRNRFNDGLLLELKFLSGARFRCRLMNKSTHNQTAAEFILRSFHQLK